MRVKTGFTRHRHHRKILRANRGFRMTKHRLYKVAHEARLHAGQYAYIGRKNRKRDLRSLWIVRLNAALHHAGMTYNHFIHGLKTSKIELNRKVLAELAVNYPQAFNAIVEKVKTK